eukprot:SAG31_NODE_4584_length_3117_cov_1.583830_2_plen_118_part_00
MLDQSKSTMPKEEKIEAFDQPLSLHGITIVLSFIRHVGGNCGCNQWLDGTTQLLGAAHVCGIGANFGGEGGDGGDGGAGRLSMEYVVYPGSDVFFGAQLEYRMHHGVDGAGARPCKD